MTSNPIGIDVGLPVVNGGRNRLGVVVAPNRENCIQHDDVAMMNLLFVSNIALSQLYLHGSVPTPIFDEFVTCTVAMDESFSAKRSRILFRF